MDQTGRSILRLSTKSGPTHGNEKDRLIALEQYAIVRSIFFEGKPAIVPEWQIDNLRKMLEKGSDVSVMEQLAVGAHVKHLGGV